MNILLDVANNICGIARIARWSLPDSEMPVHK